MGHRIEEKLRSLHKQQVINKWSGICISGALSMKQTAEENRKRRPMVVKVKWIDGYRFVANDDKGHSVVMDVSKEHGGEGSGFSPMQLLLVAFAGCTGYDIVEILRKGRQKLEDLEILVSGERVSEPPRVYKEVRIEYKVKGAELKKKAVEQAIQLSMDKYCSVGATLKKTANVSYEFCMQ